MLTLTWTTVPPPEHDLDPSGATAYQMETVSTVEAAELADNHEAAASDDDFPVAIVLVVLVLIVVGVVGGILGFRSTRRKTETLEERRHGRPLP